MKLIPRMTTRELEEIQIHAEGKILSQRDIKLADYILDLCAEIKRLRYTYGEPYWIPCSKTDVEILAERKAYQEQKYDDKWTMLSVDEYELIRKGKKLGSLKNKLRSGLEEEWQVIHNGLICSPLLSLEHAKAVLLSIVDDASSWSLKK